MIGPVAALGLEDTKRNINIVFGPASRGFKALPGANSYYGFGEQKLPSEYFSGNK